jgi:hypothetical protein
MMNTSATGTVALVGAGEYLPEMLPVDKKLLELVNGTPHVAVVPTASAPMVKAFLNAGHVWVLNTLLN